MREVPLLHLTGPAGGPGEDEQERNPKGPSEEPSGTQVNRAGAGWADLSLQISVLAAWGEEGTESGAGGGEGSQVQPGPSVAPGAERTSSGHAGTAFRQIQDLLC